jgi:hypothetical protein
LRRSLKKKEEARDDKDLDRLRGLYPWLLSRLVVRERIRRIAEPGKVPFFEAAMRLRPNAAPLGEDHPDDKKDR